MEWINADIELPEPIDLTEYYFPKTSLTDRYYLVLVEHVPTGKRYLQVAPYVYDDDDPRNDAPHWHHNHIIPPDDKVIAWARISTPNI